MYANFILILTYVLLFFILDVLLMLIVLYRAFVLALETHLDGRIDLPIKSRLSIIVTVLDVYDELFRGDFIDTLFSMPLHALSTPNLGADSFSYPFLRMMEDGAIVFDVEDVSKKRKKDD